MNKAEFVELVKSAGKFSSKKEAEVAVNAFVGAVEKALSKKNGSVELVGFGKFETVLQKGKTGKVPGSNKTYKTSDKYVPKFKPGKSLKDIVAKSRRGHHLNYNKSIKCQGINKFHTSFISFLHFLFVVVLLLLEYLID